AADIARWLGDLEVRSGDFAAALPHCQQADAASALQHSALDSMSCTGEALLGLGRADDALAQLAPMITAVDATPPEERFVSVGRIGRGRFAYAGATVLRQAHPRPPRARP